MARFEIQFVQSGTLKREDETIEADYFVDSGNGEFVDFERRMGGGTRRVARYRAADIRRILTAAD